jgi:MFS family permease
MWLFREGRDALILSACNALFWSGLMISITLSGLIGQALAPSPALATLPAGLLTVATTLLASPVSMLMQRAGRRAGFALGAAAGALGGCVCAGGILAGSFLVFCAGNLVLGGSMAASQYYRFAAVDRVAPERRGRATSVVLAGGVVAALVAPTLALWTKDLLAPTVYAGSFLGLAALSLAILLPVSLLPGGAGPGAAAAGRPLGAAEILRRPAFRVALANAAVGHTVMILIMHATSLAMVAHHHHPVEDAAGVIRWHVLGMFLPAFFAGRLIDRLGAARVATAGALVLAASVAASASGPSLVQFQVGLALLGVGWNLMYVSGTVMLAQAHAPEERGRVQGLFEMLVVGAAALGSFASAGLLSAIGWRAVNLGALPLLLGAVALTALHLGRARPRAAPPEAAPAKSH